jgi:hypothetical protein
MLLVVPIDMSLTDETPEAVVERQVAAFNAHDVSAFLATYAENAVVVGAAGAASRVEGRAALLKHYEKRLAQPNLNAVIEQRMCMGRWVVDYELVSTSETTPEPAIAVYEVAHGLIQKATIVRLAERALA